METRVREITADDAAGFLELLKQLDLETSFMLMDPGALENRRGAARPLSLVPLSVVFWAVVGLLVAVVLGRGSQGERARAAERRRR